MKFLKKNKKREGFTHKYFEEEMEKIAVPSSMFTVTQFKASQMLFSIVAFRQVAWNHLYFLSLME